jgi:hypothetical protein
MTRFHLVKKEERRLRVFEKRVLRRVFGPKRDDVTGKWRKLHKEELNDLYSLPKIVRVVKSRRMRWAGHVARVGEDRGVHRVLMEKPEEKRSLGRPRRRWEDNIKMRVWGKIEVCTGCWWGSLRERSYWGDQDVDGRIKLRCAYGGEKRCAQGAGGEA